MKIEKEYAKKLFFFFLTYLQWTKQFKNIFIHFFQMEFPI